MSEMPQDTSSLVALLWGLCCDSRMRCSTAIIALKSSVLAHIAVWAGWSVELEKRLVSAGAVRTAHSMA